MGAQLAVYDLSPVEPWAMVTDICGVLCPDHVHPEKA